MTLNAPTTLERVAKASKPILDTQLIMDNYAEASLEDRCAPRYKLKIPAMLRPSGSQGFHISVQDLSLSGFSAEAFTGQPLSTRIWLTIPGLSPIEGSIVHNDGTTIGCAFTNLLNPAVFENLVARYRVDE